MSVGIIFFPGIENISVGLVSVFQTLHAFVFSVLSVSSVVKAF